MKNNRLSEIVGLFLILALLIIVGYANQSRQQTNKQIYETKKIR
jgi:hypothetical protein